MKAFFSSALFLVLPLLSLHADLTIVSEIKTKDLQPQTGGNFTLKLTEGKARVDAGPGHVIILPLEKKMYVLVPDQKMCMEKSLANLPSAENSSGEAPKIERTGKKETISGYDCEQVLVTDSKGGRTELWISPSAPDASQFASTFRAIADQSPQKHNNEWLSLMKDKDLATFPIRVISYDKSGTEQSRSTVISISKDTIPASEFQVPAGYQIMPLPDFGGVGGTDIQPSSPAPSSSNPSNYMQKMQELQKKAQSGQMPSAQDIKKMEDMARQLQQQQAPGN